MSHPTEPYRHIKFHADQIMRGQYAAWVHDHTEEVGDCLIWTGGCSHKGKQPSMVLPRVLPDQPGTRARRVLVARAIYESTKKRIPAGHVLMRKCDDPLCLNVDHMNNMTKAQANAINARMGKCKLTDLQIAKRVKTGIQYRKTTDEQNAYIRAEMAKVPNLRGTNNVKGQKATGGKMTRAAELAQEFGIKQRTVLLIARTEPAIKGLGMFSQLLAANQSTMRKAA